VDPRIAWAVAHLEEDLHRPSRVADLARAVNLSPSRFTHLFRAMTGDSPARYLQMRRLELARVLLETTFLSVKEVMAKVGFNDPSHFTHAFSRHHGIAPSRLRGTRVAPETVDVEPMRG
jgi:AraC family transcriptional regulator, arabinose operon regulatory protein